MTATTGRAVAAPSEPPWLAERAPVASSLFEEFGAYRPGFDQSRRRSMQLQLLLLIPGAFRRRNDDDDGADSYWRSSSTTNGRRGYSLRDAPASGLGTRPTGREQSGTRRGPKTAFAAPDVRTAPPTESIRPQSVPLVLMVFAIGALCCTVSAISRERHGGCQN